MVEVVAVLQVEVGEVGVEEEEEQVGVAEAEVVEDLLKEDMPGEKELEGELDNVLTYLGEREPLLRLCRGGGGGGGA